MYKTLPIIEYPHLIKLFTPILDFIIIILNSYNKSDIIISVFHLVVRLHSIILLKCKKNNIKIESADDIMNYLEFLCKMIKYNNDTNDFIEILNKINYIIESKLDKIYQEEKNNLNIKKNKSITKILRKCTSSIDDYDDIIDIDILSEIDLNRWNIVNKLINRC